ncbi:MAG TPA: hypothetical protein VE487_01380 [Ilumatobacter sp.]|jgi:hypothetical protein|nr:hypothetical protein [Ilumatobacter sp.]
MVITDDTLQAEQAAFDGLAGDPRTKIGGARRPPGGKRTGRVVAIGAGIVVLSTGILLAGTRSGDSNAPDQPAPASRPSDDVVRDLVERGVVPAATLGDGSPVTAKTQDPTSQIPDAVVRDLVARGVVPAATLGDGSQVANLPATPSRDQAVRELVAQGLVPAATLDDGSQVATAPATPSRDQAVRELVAQGFVPAATLDDGSGITR